MFLRLLLLVGAAGLVTSTGYLLLVLIASARFRRNQRRRTDGAAFPPVTLLKPVHGMEPDLEANLASFFEQQYPSFEIIFGARHADDPALEVVRRISGKYPSVPVKIVTTGEPLRPNAKVCSLVKMYARARPRLPHHQRQRCACRAQLHCGGGASAAAPR